MEVFDIFPNPIYREVYPDAKNLKKVIIDIMQDKDMIVNGMSSELFHYENISTESFLYKKEFDSFREWIEEKSTEFVRDVLGYSLESKMLVTNSWANICNSGGSQYPHYHTNAYISGTYYVNFEEGHAPLFFRHTDSATHSSSPSISLESNKERPGKYNSDVIIWPKEGELLLWQSNLSHGYVNNQKDNRVSVSMNLMPEIVNNDKYSYRVVPMPR